jgi:protein involved in sex pheromone biosynthesis
MRIKRTLGVIAAATLIMVTGCGNAVDENVEKENTPAQESSVPVEPTESASDAYESD